MKKAALLILILLASILVSILHASAQKELHKIAVWDLTPGDIKPAYAQDLTSILVSEISKLGKYEVYSQENVRTLAGWTAERMQLGCTDTKCLTALGQMDIAKLISGRVGKIGKTYSISLHLFDTQKVRAENSISEECKSEDELIPLARQAIRKLLGVEGASSREPEDWVLVSFKDLYTDMEFILVKGGCFEMGDTFGDGDPEEKPVHEVCVDDFYMGKYEVTQGQWRAVMGSNPSHFKSCGDDCPVEQVSWNDAQDFISRLNQKTGKKFRLPTEAEWEYAARSGGEREKWAGTSNESELGGYAWYEKNSRRTTHSIGQKKTNGRGLYDMSGNVWEWCQDWFSSDYYQTSPKDNPSGPSNGNTRVLRGGSWDSMARDIWVANRNRNVPAIRYLVNGFRLVLPSR